MRSISLCTLLFALVVPVAGCRAVDAAADGGPDEGEDAGPINGARMDGSRRLDGATRGDARTTDGAIRGGGDPFMDARLGDGSLYGDSGEHVDGSLGPDGSLGCTLSSCGPGYECCVDDGTCQPISCAACCARRPDASGREDARVPGREDAGLPSGSDSGSVRREDGGGLILPIDDGGWSPGLSCGSVVCDFGTFCCPESGVCVPSDCPECCGGGGPFPPPEPPPPPPGF